MNLKKIFSEDDLAAIEQAVKDAESKTSGEIVPYIAECSDAYEETAWMFGMWILALNMAIFTLLTPKFAFLADPKYYLMFTLSITILATLLIMACTPLRIILTLYDKKKYRVAMAAREKFLSEEVFNTRERTGIIIYISMAERRVEIVGDSGINKKVSQDKWQSIADNLVAGMKHKQYKDSIIQAIAACGELLQQSNVQRRDDDTNELDDSVRFDK